MRKICVVTGTRAEYGILHWLMKEVSEDPELELQIIVTGMHLSSEFGLTWKEVERDGFKIDYKVEMLLSADTSSSIVKSVGLGLIGFSDAFQKLNPDIVVILGDRYEILAVACCALISKIPIAHIAGGEVTEGVFDESIRHAITKMSHIHFTATEAYKKRVIQLGERPNHVFNYGGIAVDTIQRTTFLSQSEFERSIAFKLNQKNLLITFHPVTLETDTSERQFNELLQAIEELEDTHFIFTGVNSDTNGRIIFTKTGEFVEKNNHKAIAFKSLGQVRYLSALKFVDAVVGNSSSGLTEAPTFKIGTVNIGDRQKGRIKAASIIDCDPNKESILLAFEHLYSDEFHKKLRNVVNPYGSGGASIKIKETLKNINLSGILKKKFYDMS